MTDKNGKHPGIQLDINAVKLADITGDLTPIAEGAGKTLGAVPTLLHRLCLLIFDDWYMLFMSVAARSFMQVHRLAVSSSLM